MYTNPRYSLSIIALNPALKSWVFVVCLRNLTYILSKLGYMRTKTTTRTMKTVCGKTVTYMHTEGEIAKMHSLEGPALIYPESEGKAPEYYLFGIKYSKAEWKTLINQHKAMPIADGMTFEPTY